MSDSVQPGLWKNHDASSWHGTQILVKEQTAVKLTNVIAIVLTLSLARLWIFVKVFWPMFVSLYVKIWFFIFRRHVETLDNPNPLGDELHDQGIRLEEIGPQMPAEPARIAAGLRNTVEQSPSFEIAAGRLFGKHIFMGNIQFQSSASGVSRILNRLKSIARNFREDPLAFSGILLLAGLFFAIFICLQIIAICASTIILSGTAEIKNSHCGAWEADLTSNISVTARIQDLNIDVMFKAISYAEKCYEATSQSEECSFFYSSRVPFKEDHTAPCPFQDLCYSRNSSVYHLDTGYTNSRILGINEKEVAEFRIQRTCAPLRPDPMYVKVININHDSNRVEYHYGDYYGLQETGNLTLEETLKAPWILMPGSGPMRYHISTYGGNFLFRDEYHQAGPIKGRNFIPELRVRDSHTTLFFVRPPNIMYLKPSPDLIFPATQSSSRSMHDGTPLYWNALQYSTILACAESFEIRNPRSGAIWFPRYQNTSQLLLPEWHHPSTFKSIQILNMSYVAFRKQYSNALTMESRHFQVHRKIQSFFSAPLNHDQWEIEVRKMFTTRLALLQHNVLGIAQGTGYDLPTARNILLDYGRDGCANIMFRSREFKNISLFGLIGFLILAAAVCVLTTKVEQTPILVWLLKEGALPAMKAILDFWRRIDLRLVLGYLMRKLEMLKALKARLSRRA